MKVVILAGGRGSRISEETHNKPKPIIAIGGKPILWHIMSHYSRYGFREFIICLGYKGHVIKDYFARFHFHSSDVTINTGRPNDMQFHSSPADSWTVTLVNTGDDTNTAGRIKRVSDYLDDKSFFLTYGDGVSNVNLNSLLKLHTETHADVTLTAVRAPGRYGAVSLAGDRVLSFEEKVEGYYSRINGGFFVVHPSILDLITSDDQSWEYDILPVVAQSHVLSAFNHDGFWQAMDTLRDKDYLDKLCESDVPPWLK